MFETLNPVSLIVTIASMSLLPLVAVTATSFLKISAVLMILRNAIGVQQVPSNMVLYGVAMVMSMIVMAPVIKDAGARFAPGGQMPQTGTEIIQAVDNAIPPFKVFMLKHSEPEYHQRFYETALKFQDKYQSAPMEKNDLFVLMPSFVASELAEAFRLGVLIYLPFVIIDLVASSALMALGMMMVSPMSITTPLKILLFVAIEGWIKVFSGLIESYLV
jgi:type III secretion protein R